MDNSTQSKEQLLTQVSELRNALLHLDDLSADGRAAWPQLMQKRRDAALARADILSRSETRQLRERSQEPASLRLCKEIFGDNPDIKLLNKRATMLVEYADRVREQCAERACAYMATLWGEESKELELRSVILKGEPDA